MGGLEPKPGQDLQPYLADSPCKLSPTGQQAAAQCNRWAISCQFAFPLLTRFLKIPAKYALGDKIFPPYTMRLPSSHGHKSPKSQIPAAASSQSQSPNHSGTHFHFHFDFDSHLVLTFDI